MSGKYGTLILFIFVVCRIPCHIKNMDFQGKTRPYSFYVIMHNRKNVRQEIKFRFAFLHGLKKFFLSLRIPWFAFLFFVHKKDALQNFCFLRLNESKSCIWIKNICFDSSWNSVPSGYCVGNFSKTGIPYFAPVTHQGVQGSNALNAYTNAYKSGCQNPSVDYLAPWVPVSWNYS